MPLVSFVADEDDFRTILAYLNDRPDVAFIVADGPGRWRAVQTLDRIDVDRIALWHIPSGPLPLLQSKPSRPDERVHDPWGGWNELRAGADSSEPYFGPGHPGVIWLQYNPKGRGTRHGVGISLFEWIGNYFSRIGQPASRETEEFWKDLRRWLTRQTMPQDSAGDSRAFPSAMAKIRAASQSKANPASE
jgi:hypothetical protein